MMKAEMEFMENTHDLDSEAAQQQRANVWQYMLSMAGKHGLKEPRKGSSTPLRGLDDPRCGFGNKVFTSANADTRPQANN